MGEAPKDLKASLQCELDKLLSKRNEAKHFTIFRTPHNISQSKKNLFEPCVISIGPFHHAQTRLRALEEQKLPFLQDFLSRYNHITLDLCILEMKKLEERARGCYSETFDDLDSNVFVKMMLLDGCFLFEYFSKKMDMNWNSIYEVGWNSHFINCDLILQENQIPFFIVDKLVELIGFNKEYRMYFVQFLARNLLPSNTIFSDHRAETLNTIDSMITDPLAEIPFPDEIHHLVHLCYYYFVPNPEKPVVLSSKSFVTTIFSANRITDCLYRFLSWVPTRRSSHSTSRMSSRALPNSTEKSSTVIPSATELTQKGLKFARKGNPKHMLDISFKYGVLKIPKLVITDDTKPIFASLIAFENSNYGKENSPFTTFVTFLNYLVKTQNDVTILQECGIIENWLGSEEEFTHFINQVTKGNFISRDHYLADLYMEVNRYIISHRRKARWNRQREKLIREYFSSPWKTISLFAAFILLVLTCIQTFYTVYAYKFPPS